jgi:hypothetical protein
MKRPSSLPARGFAILCILALARGTGAQPGARGSGPFEETSPAITWSGSWSKNSLPAQSGGGAMLTMEAGAQASFAFSGPSASWIGYRDEWCGLADVFLDGALQATVDTYAAPARAQATLYSIDGLREGRHTLTIQAKGARGPDSRGSWVWVDAFAIAAAPSTALPASSEPLRRQTPAFSNEPQARTPRNSGGSRSPHREPSSRVEQEDPAVSWIGPWSTNRLAVHGGHSARLSMDAGARVEFAFRGAGVSWVGYQDEWSGIADVLLDGRLVTTVDTYSKPARAQVELYAVDGLREGPHTLTIQPTGRRRPASGGTWIWVDGFFVSR